MRPEDLMEHEVKEIKKAFHYFDRLGNGRVQASRLGDCLRWLKLSPSEAEIEELTKSADPNQTGYMNFDAFLRAAAQVWISDQQKETKIWGAFLSYDKAERGKIPFDDLKDILTEKSREPLAEKEARKLLKNYVDKDGMVEYSYMIRAWQK